MIGYHTIGCDLICFYLYSCSWCSWNEWLTLPVKFSDLPRNGIVAFTVWDIEGTFKAVPVGGSSIRIFSKRGYVLTALCFLYDSFLADFNFLLSMNMAHKYSFLQRGTSLF